MEFKRIFEKDEKIQAFGSNALLLFAMMLKFDEIDENALAAECLTDGSDDKKIDFIRYDSDMGRVTLAQGYFAQDWNKRSAYANKASDLNTAISWLISGDLRKSSEKNKNLRAKALAIRDALEAGEVESLELLYVHNLQTSENVRKELETCAKNARKLLETYPSKPEVIFEEVGASRINEWYLSRERPIVVKDSVPIPVSGFFEEDGQEWKAIIASTKASVIRNLYEQYGDDLFSANLRGFLGIRGSTRNINQHIKLTAEKTPDLFMIYNNGITAITNGCEHCNDHLLLDGIAIINGAQTTGSLHKAKPDSLDLARVMLRIIVTKNRKLIDDVVRYNNTQNVVYTWELRNGDRIQTRLTKEFALLNMKYLNRRSYRRAHGDVIPVPAAAQALMAFHGKPLAALKGKTEIFESDNTYSSIFHDHTTAEHICFVYSIVAAFDEYKNALKLRKEEDLTELEEKRLEYMSHISFKQFLTYSIGFSIESILGRKITNKSQLQFKNSKVSLKVMAERWLPIIDIAVNSITSSTQSLNDLHFAMKSDDRMEKVAIAVQGFISSLRPYSPAFDTFTKTLKP